MKTVTSMRSLCTLAVLLLSVGVGRVNAAPLNLYSFAGTVERSACRGGCEVVDVGDPFSGFFTYEILEDSTLSINYEVSFTQGGQPGRFFSGSNQTIFLTKSPGTSNFNLVNFDSRTTFPFGHGGFEFSLFLMFKPNSFPGHRLTSSLDLENLIDGTMAVSDLSSYDVQGRINSVSAKPIPEPSTMLLVGCGAWMLSRSRRARSRSQR
jgi:hypothetical protein